MKDYKQFIKQLPSNSIVCALGEFNPPTIAHELLIKTAKVVAEQRNCDHVIFTTSSETLQEDRKQHYLKLLFPTSNFVSLGESFFATVVKKLNEKYKNVVIIAGADQFDEFKSLKESSNVEVISIGTKDPDADGSKMKQIATKGIYEDFKKLLPSTIRDIDGKRLMNEMRVGMELEPVKEQINLVKDKLREKYFRGEVFNVGQLVESNGQQYQIVKRGSNHLLLKDQAGELVSKWITDVKEIKEGVIQPNGTDKVETNSPESAGNNQAVPNKKGKVKGFLTFYNYDDKTKNVNEGNGYDDNRTGFAKKPREDDEYHNEPKPKFKARSLMDRPHTVHIDGKKWKTFNNGHQAHAAVKTLEAKGKKATAIAHFKEEFDLIESALNPNDPHGDYQAKRKALQDIQMDHHTGQDPELTAELARRKADLEKEYEPHRIKEETVDEKKDREKQLKRFKDQAAANDRPCVGTEYNELNDPFFKEDITDEELDSITEEELLGLDEHTEWDLVYEDTEEVIPVHPDEEQIDLMEVLSRQERLKGKIRLRRTAAKRERSTKISLQRFSNPKTINKRARRLAIKLIKQRMVRGRNLSKLSVGDKERIEKAMAKRKDMVNRVAQKLVVRIRKVEKSRMSKGKTQKGAMPAVF